MPASIPENDANRVMLDHLAAQGVTGRLELVLVDRGMTAGSATTLGRRHGVEVRRVGWDNKPPVFRPSGKVVPHPPVSFVRTARGLGCVTAAVLADDTHGLAAA